MGDILSGIVAVWQARVWQNIALGVKPVLDSRRLLGGAFQPIDVVGKGLPAWQPINIPANMFARGAHAGTLTIKMVVIRKMRQEQIPHFVPRGRS